MIAHHTSSWQNGSMKYLSIALSALFLLSACEGLLTPDENQGPAPARQDIERARERGKLTGDGLVIAGGKDKSEESGSPLGVNSFLWRATLDTLSFMPLASADPFGGVILTDWYEDPNARGERFKMSVLILGRSLRADGINATLFKQSFNAEKGWQDETVDKGLSRKLEDTILTRARQLRVKSIAQQ